MEVVELVGLLDFEVFELLDFVVDPLFDEDFVELDLEPELLLPLLFFEVEDVVVDLVALDL